MNYFLEIYKVTRIFKYFSKYAYNVRIMKVCAQKFRCCCYSTSKSNVSLSSMIKLTVTALAHDTATSLIYCCCNMRNINRNQTA